MISRYSKPTENPYVPMPWDVISQTEGRRQNLIGQNELLRQQYAAQTQQMDFGLKMKRLEDDQQKQALALQNMEQSNLFLSQFKAYGEKDQQKLNLIKENYNGVIKEMVEKYSDNPFKLAAATQALKMDVAQNAQGGDLYHISNNFARAQKNREMIDEMYMKGDYDDHYYRLASSNYLNMVPKTPDRGKLMMNFATKITSQNPDITKEDELAKHILNYYVQSEDGDYKILKQSGLNDEQIASMITPLALEAAWSQRETLEKNRSRKGSGASDGATYSAREISQFVDRQLDKSYRPAIAPVDEKMGRELDGLFERQGTTLAYYDIENDKQVTFKDIAKELGKKEFKPIVEGMYVPGTHRFAQLTKNKNFANSVKVRIGNKEYVAANPAFQSDKVSNDAATDMGAMFELSMRPYSGGQVVSQFGMPFHYQKLSNNKHQIEFKDKRFYGENISQVYNEFIESLKTR